MNSTHNVTVTTKRLLTEEFKRANNLLKKCSPENRKTVWEQVLEKENVFVIFRHFLMIEILAHREQVCDNVVLYLYTTIKAHGKWEGWIGSRIRFLIKKLETIPNIIIRPWPEFYKYQVCYHVHGY